MWFSILFRIQGFIRETQSKETAMKSSPPQVKGGDAAPLGSHLFLLLLGLRMNPRVRKVYGLGEEEQILSSKAFGPLPLLLFIKVAP